MKFRRLCLVDTPYSLLVYLLYCSEEEFNKTFFVIGENMPPEIVAHLPHYYQFLRKKSLFNKRFAKWILYRVKIWLHLPTIGNDIQIFAHDHLPVSPVIIGHHPYIMIEDSPLICSHYIASPAYQKNMKARRSFRTRIYRYLYGPILKSPFADNSQCQGMLMTIDDDAIYIKSKKHLIYNLNEAWNLSSDIMRRRILDVFGMKESEIEQIRCRSEILFTQPLTDFITIEEQKQIYTTLAQKYSPEQLVIKVHPRDMVCYERILPNYMVFRKPVPSQLLDILGVKFDRAITLFSSAAINFSYPIKIDWYGTEICEQLLKKCGTIEPPQNLSGTIFMRSL